MQTRQRKAIKNKDKVVDTVERTPDSGDISSKSITIDEQISVAVEDKDSKNVAFATVKEQISVLKYGIVDLPEPRHMTFALPCNHTPYIEFGYRVDYTYMQCILSLFSLHNETMNIWSHLLGFICTVIAGVTVLVEFQNHDLPLFGRVAYATYVMSSSCCLLFSAVYHTFGCISSFHQQTLLILDLGGVAFLTGGSLFVWIVYGFHCYPTLCTIYSCFCGIIFLLGIVIAYFGSYATRASYVFRMIGFISIGAMGLIPCAHWYLITPVEVKQELIVGVVGVFLSYVVGLCFYVSRFPESKWPDSYFVTHFVSSHLWWHLCVCSAVFILLHQAMAYQLLIAKLGCPNLTV